MRGALIAVALVALGVGVVWAQARPNFSGTWVQVLPAESAGGEIVLKHDESARTLREQHASSGDDHQLLFILDGREHTDEPIDAGSGHEIVSKHTASWTGNVLTIDQVADYQGGFHREARQVWSIDPQGQLRIALTSNTPDGTTLNLTLVYRRK